MISAIRAAPKVASKTTWSSGARLWAKSSSASGCGLDPFAGAQLAALGDRHLAPIAMNVHPNEAHDLSFRLSSEGEGGQSDKDGFVLAAHPGKSQGRP